MLDRLVEVDVNVLAVNVVMEEESFPRVAASFQRIPMEMRLLGKLPLKLSTNRSETIGRVLSFANANGRRKFSTGCSKFSKDSYGNEVVGKIASKIIDKNALKKWAEFCP